MARSLPVAIALAALGPLCVSLAGCVSEEPVRRPIAEVIETNASTLMAMPGVVGVAKPIPSIMGAMR